jgi:hypothetical protein
MTQGLRTTGTHTGNFGRAKVQGKPGELYLTKDILNKENLKIAGPGEGLRRLIEAYNKTSDPRLKRSLLQIIREKKASQVNKSTVAPKEEVGETVWDHIRKVR